MTIEEEKGDSEVIPVIKGEVVEPRVVSYSEPRPVHPNLPPVDINNAGHGDSKVIDVTPEEDTNK